MKYVHIISMDPKTRDVRTRATCVLADDATVVECTGDEVVTNSLRLGVFDPTRMRTVTPDDGEAFLEALPHEYRHPSLLATDVIEGDTVEPYALPPARTPDKDAA